MTIDIKDIVKEYFSKGGKTLAVNGVSFSLPETGFVCVSGESGSGKTTLLNLLGGLDVPTRGEISYNGELVSEFSEKKWNDIRNEKMAYVFQNYALIEEESVFQNLRYVTDIRTDLSNDSRQCIEEALETVGLSDCIQKNVSELSGGQKQRVAIARALLKRPEIIFADEPTGNLDSENSDIIFHYLQEISKSVLVVVVTHDRERISKYADREICMVDGEISTDVIFVSKEEENAPASGNGNPTNREVHCERRNLSMKEKIRNATVGIRSSKKRFVIVTLGLTIAFLLLLCVIAVLSNDFIMSITNYYETGNNKIAVISVENTRADRGVDSEELYFGKLIHEKLCKICTGQELITIEEGYTVASSDPGIQYFSDTEVHPKIIPQCTVSMQGTRKDLSFCAGVGPGNREEIAITDYVADIMGLSTDSIGQEIWVSGQTLMIVGIVDTDYEEYNPDKHIMMQDEYSAEAEYLWTIVYSTVYVSEDYTETIIEDYQKNDKVLRLQGINITESNNIYKYTEQINKLGVASTSLKMNEVIISEEYANQYEIDENKLPLKIKLKDIHSKELYGNAYYEVINLYEYIGSEVIITAITEDNAADVYCSKSLYDVLAEDYFRFYSQRKYGICFDGNETETVLRELDKIGANLKDPNIHPVYKWKGVVEEYAKYGGVILSLLCILVVLLYLIFTLYELRLQRKKIGILKSQGYSKGTLLSIQVIQNVMVLLIAEIIAGGVFLLFMYFFNREIAKDEQMLHYYDIFNPRWMISGLVLLGIVVVFCACMIIIARKMLNKVPIEIMKE